MCEDEGGDGSAEAVGFGVGGKRRGGLWVVPVVPVGG